METINRRQLNQNLSHVLDKVIETGEPIQVQGRDGRAVLISPAKDEESEWDRLNRLGLIERSPNKMTDEEFEDFILSMPAHPEIDYDAVMESIGRGPDQWY